MVQNVSLQYVEKHFVLASLSRFYLRFAPRFQRHSRIRKLAYTKEDKIEIRDKTKQLAIIDIALASKERETPEYIQMDEKNKKFKFVRTPKLEEVPYPIVMEPNLVIEYYSR